MKRALYGFTALALILSDPIAAQATGFGIHAFENTSYLDKFAGRLHKLSDYGVVADGTDMTSVLNNNLPTDGTPLIGDCINGNQIVINGTWTWQDHHTVYWDNNCQVVSLMWATSVTQPVQPVGSVLVPLGTYPFANTGGLLASNPLTKVEDYNLQFSFRYPSQGMRMMQIWADTLRMKHFLIDGSGGFAFNRGGDQEYAFGVMINTIQAAGNPGLRHTGNLKVDGTFEVPTGPGLQHNVDAHDNNWDTGDASLQTCQPTPYSSPTGTWSSTSGGTRDMGYRNIITAGTDASILVGISPATGTPPYACDHIYYYDITSANWWAIIIASGNNVTKPDQVVIKRLNYTATILPSTGKYATQAVAGLGNVKRGPTTFTGGLGTITISDSNFGNALNQTLDAEGPMDLHLINDTFGATTGVFALPNVLIEGATSGELTNVSVAATNGDAMQIGGPGFTTNLTGKGLTLTNVPNGFAGLDLQGTLSGTMTTGTVTAALSATTAIGVEATVGALGTGTWGANVKGFDLHLMPVPTVPATGQGNIFQSNTGAADSTN